MEEWEVIEEVTRKYNEGNPNRQLHKENIQEILHWYRAISEKA